MKDTEKLTKLKTGDFVAYYHGMPIDTDYGVILDEKDDNYLCYSPFYQWEFHSRIITKNDLHGIIKIEGKDIENSRTDWEPHRDGQRFSHTVSETVEYSKISGLFDKRKKNIQWSLK